MLSDDKFRFLLAGTHSTPDNGDNAAVIIGAIVAVIVILIIVMLAIITFRR